MVAFELLLLLLLAMVALCVAIKLDLSVVDDAADDDELVIVMEPSELAKSTSLFRVFFVVIGIEVDLFKR